ncbi:MAG TPA: carbohydrate-binding protein, partial [bacterium]|nr:carbohydrate-binding protein [bacterium]
YNAITNALWDAVGFSSNGLNNTLQNNTITNPGLDGIAFGSQTKDLGTCTGDALLLNNTVTGLNTGRSALLTQGGYATYTPIMASTANTVSGATSEACSEGGQDMGSIINGSYLEYNNVNLGGVVTFIARVASAGAGGNIEVRMDSPSGTLLGTSTVAVTGCWQTWAQTYTTLTGASGTHNLYLVFTGGAGNLFNLQWFALTSYGII